MAAPIRVSITEHDLRRLMSGEILRIHGAGQPNVEISIFDMGFDLIKEIVEEAAATAAAKTR